MSHYEENNYFCCHRESCWQGNHAAWKCEFTSNGLVAEKTVPGMHLHSRWCFRNFRGKNMDSISHLSMPTYLSLVMSLCCQCHAWRWPVTSQPAQSFSDLLRIKNGSPQKTFIQDNRGSSQQQNYATEEHFWTSLGTKSGSYSSSGLDVTSPYSAYGLIHKVANNPCIWSSHHITAYIKTQIMFEVFAKVLWDSGRRDRRVQYIPWGLQGSEV